MRESPKHSRRATFTLLLPPPPDNGFPSVPTAITTGLPSESITRPPLSLYPAGKAIPASNAESIIMTGLPRLSRILPPDSLNPSGRAILAHFLSCFVPFEDPSHTFVQLIVLLLDALEFF